MDTPRPSHADYSGYMRYNGFNDVSGGGQFSGRLTAPLCFAGAVCMQILEEMGIDIQAHILSIKDVKDEKFNPINISNLNIDKKEFPVINGEQGDKMKDEIEKARMMGDSVGGAIECAVTGVKAGFGDPMFDGVENKFAKNIFGIPAVKGIEFGNGFDATTLYGSENNDAFCVVDGEIKTKTNNAGGINGGITNGMPIVFRTAIKPTPSISIPQKTIDFVKQENTTISITGRHDPAIIRRIGIVIDNLMAIVIADMLYSKYGCYFLNFEVK